MPTLAEIRDLDVINEELNLPEPDKDAAPEGEEAQESAAEEPAAQDTDAETETETGETRDLDEKA